MKEKTSGFWGFQRGGGAAFVGVWQNHLENVKVNVLPLKVSFVPIPAHSRIDIFIFVHIFISFLYIFKSHFCTYFHSICVHIFKSLFFTCAFSFKILKSIYFFLYIFLSTSRPHRPTFSFLLQKHNFNFFPGGVIRSGIHWLIQLWCLVGFYIFGFTFVFILYFWLYLILLVIFFISGHILYFWLYFWLQFWSYFAIHYFPGGVIRLRIHKFIQLWCLVGFYIFGFI